MKLQPFVELAKQITDTQLCEIDIVDVDYQRTVAHNGTGAKVAPQCYSVNHETIRMSRDHEIFDLSNNSRYKDLSCVKCAPWLRYYYGVKLTTSGGKDIGTISVSDPAQKRISKEQKIQFKLLARAVMETIESEFSHRNLSGELDIFRDNLLKLNHDVRSPISGIIGLADFLIDDLEEVNVQARDIMMIRESAKSIVDIITGVLATQDGVKNREELLERKPLSEVFKKLEGLYNPLAQHKKVTLSLTNQIDNTLLLPYYFYIKLLRIMGNLVSNAIKFSPENGTVGVIFSGNSNSKLSELNITVRNAGKIMSSKQITMFTNGDPVARSNGTGAGKSFGTGLQHVYQMISEEKGSIAIESSKGSGTLFSISLPLPAYNGKKARKFVPLKLNGFAKPAVNGTDRLYQNINLLG
jgi:signal transduction histidine kinase